MRRGMFRFCGLILAGILTACSGSGGDDNGGVTPQGGTVVGAAGGTVEGPAGVRIVIPPGALAADTAILIEQNSDGAPELPGDFSPIGPMYALTPHGLQFALPVTLTVPFDPAAVAAGSTPALYKTNATQTAWEAVAGATVNGATISGQISGFSFVTAAVPQLASSDPFPPHRIWEFVGHDASDQELSLDHGEVFEGVLFEQIEFGSLIIAPSGNDNIARGQVFSNESGMTYWVAAEAPRGEAADPLDRIGGETRLLQRQFFRKHADDATLRFIVTQVWLDAIDNNGAAPVFAECPWAAGTGPADVCLDEVLGEIDLSIAVVREASQLHAAHQGTVRLWGWQENWKWEVQSSPVLRRRGHVQGGTEIQTVRATPIFHEGQLDYLVEDGAAPATSAKIRLREPFVIAIDLSAIPACVPTTNPEHPCVGGEFFIETTATALAHNRRGRESFVGTYLRDPINSSGLNWETSGLKTIAPYAVAGPIIEPDPQCNGSTTSAAGELQFSVPTYALPEFKHTSRAVLVTRTGGTEGQVIARVQTSDGTAIAGTHYQPVMQTIVFGDGDDVPRAIEIPIVNDTVFSGPTTINLTLSAVGACANIGQNASAVVTILDDETPPPTTYAVGGSVTGLAGSGLVLQDIVTGSEAIPTNGVFTFDYRYPNGASYDVRVATQPANPTQICSVTNPSGAIANANVTNIVVTCTTPAANGALDPAFGTGGKVTSALVASSNGGNVARAAALQSDGKIVVLANMALVRFHPDGRVDESFGNAGVVPVVFNGTLNNETRDLAIDTSDRIVVVGWTRASNTTLNYDFAINRYDANGTLDPSFDGDGKVTIDFFGDVDRAQRVALDSAGRIVVAGQTTHLIPPPSPPGAPATVSTTDFVVTRLNADGTRDNDLLAKLAFTGGYSIPYGLALSPSGKIVLGGSSAASGTAVSDAALARYGADGVPDTDNDSDPAVWFGVDRSGQGADDLLYATSDQIVDLVITSDNRILGAVLTPNPNMSNTHTGANSKFNFLLVEFQDAFGDTTGQGPNIFYTELPIGPGDDRASALAIQSDGKFVMAGGTSSALSIHSDFGVVRFDANRAVDTTFGTNGVVAIDFFGGVDEAKDIVVQPDGKLLVIGVVRNGSSWNLGLVRLNP